MKKVKRLKSLAVEICKTVNNMSRECMREIFQKAAFCTHRPVNLEVKKTKQLNFKIKV